MISPDPQPIVFDQFQRYDFIRKIIEIASQGKRLRIVEIGGAYSPLRSLLNGHFLLILDLVSGVQGLDLRADGLHLPFADQSFDIVVCTDVLEHVQEERRQELISQLIRITGQILILGFPQNTPETNEADRTLFDFIRNRTGEDFAYLKEHIEFGLPEPTKIRALVEGSTPVVLEFDQANIPSWILLQKANFIASQSPEFRNAAHSMNETFNRNLNEASHDSPCYRKFLICFKNQNSFSAILNFQKELKAGSSQFVEKYATICLELADSFEKDLMVLKTEMTEKLQETTDELRKANLHVIRLQERVEKQEAIIQEKEAQVEFSIARARNLQDYLNLFLNHPAYKAYKFFKRGMEHFFPRIHNSFPPDLKYEIFQRSFEPGTEELQQQARDSLDWDIKPDFNLVTAIFDPPFDIFRQLVESVLAQTYTNWVWNLADASTTPNIWNYLQELRQKDSRIHPLKLSKNGGISSNINAALHESTGTFVVMLDHDDTIAPNALFEVASAIRKNPDVDFLYSDADKLDPKGRRCRPLFKPDWSPEGMLSYNMLNQLSVFRRSWLDQVGYLDPEMDGAQDWDLYLRIIEKTDRIHHIPKILYHWRTTPNSTAQSIRNKPYAQKAQLAALTKHLKRSGAVDPEVYFLQGHPIHQTHPLMRWKSAEDRTVSIIIPSVNQPEILGKCLNSLFDKTLFDGFRVILVDTGSTDPQTLSLYDRFSGNPKFSLIHYKEVFNFGRACNFGASVSNEDFLLFLNNDTEIIQSDWLPLMLQWFDRPEVGIVGPKLLYPNGRIQHAGVVVGFGGLAGHVFVSEQENTNSIAGPDAWYRNLSAVTGACLMIRTNLFHSIKGFDEGFQLHYSDVDLCLRAREAGYRVVYTPQVRLIHHESTTHQGLIPRSDFERASHRWQHILQEGDPFFNPNLTYTKACPDFRQEESDTPAQLHARLMKRLPQKDFIRLPDDVLM